MRWGGRFIAEILLLFAACGLYAEKENIAGPTGNARFEKFTSATGSF
jgi:hypothetical protein